MMMHKFRHKHKLTIREWNAILRVWGVLSVTNPEYIHTCCLRIIPAKYNVFKGASFELEKLAEKGYLIPVDKKPVLRQYRPKKSGYKEKDSIKDKVMVYRTTDKMKILYNTFIEDYDKFTLNIYEPITVRYAMTNPIHPDSVNIFKTADKKLLSEIRISNGKGGLPEYLKKYL
jgi:hypothetical protein